MKNFILIVIILVFFQTIAFASVNEEYETIIKKFHKINKSNDLEKITRIWNKLDENKKLLDYMEENHPYYYTLYKYWNIYFRLNELQSQLVRNAPIFTEAEIQPKGIKGEITNNFEKTIREPSRNLQSNQSIVNNYPNQNKVSNRYYATRYPNQNAIPNQVRLRRRRKN